MGEKSVFACVCMCVRVCVCYFQSVFIVFFAVACGAFFFVLENRIINLPKAMIIFYFMLVFAVSVFFFFFS